MRLDVAELQKFFDYAFVDAKEKLPEIIRDLVLKGNKVRSGDLEVIAVRAHRKLGLSVFETLKNEVPDWKGQKIPILISRDDQDEQYFWAYHPTSRQFITEGIYRKS